MIQAFAANTAEKTLTHRIGFRRAVERVEQFSMNTGDGVFKQHPVLVIVVANQEARPDTEGRCLADLLRRPSIARGARDHDMDDAP